MVYTFTGKNTFALHQELARIGSSFAAEHGEFAVERIDGNETDVDTVLQSVQSTPFLSDNKMVIISDLSSNSALFERVDELIDRALDTNEIYLVDQKLDKRKAQYKVLKERTTLTEFKDAAQQELPSWAVNTAKEFGGRLSSKDAAFLVDRVGSDQQMLSEEIKKLATYNEEITRESIRLLTDESVQGNIFALLDAAFSGSSEQALRLYREQRVAKVDPAYVVAMLTWQLHNVALALYADPSSESELISSGMSPFQARKSLQLAKHVDTAELKEQVKKLSELDAQLKSSAVDADAALELFLLEL